MVARGRYSWGLVAVHLVHGTNLVGYLTRHGIRGHIVCGGNQIRIEIEARCDLDLLDFACDLEIATDID